MEFGSEQRRGPETHELAKDVTERQSVQNANGVKGALIFEVFLHFLLNGNETGKHVAVSVDDAFGIAGGTGGEDDLQSVVGCEVIDDARLLCGQRRLEVFKSNLRRAGGEKRNFGGVASDAFGRDFASDAPHEIERASEIDGDGDDAT